MSRKKHIVIVGGGLAGISAALEVERLGGSVTLIEATQTLGGRVKTDQVDGFLLDRGFQVLLTSYPEIKALHILNELQVEPIISGALCRLEDSWVPFYNPIRHPIDFLRHIKQFPFSSCIDFAKLFQLVFLSSSTKTETTQAYLQRYKISKKSMDLFLKPFFSGVFLETKLETDQYFFRKYLKSFITGRATLPKMGMQQLPFALSNRLKSTHTLVNNRVTHVENNSVVLADGRCIQGDAVILALDQPSLARLLPTYKHKGSCTVTTLYFSIKEGRVPSKPLIYLGQNDPISTLCIPNKIQPTYAPAGYDLISVTIVDHEAQKSIDLEKNVVQTLVDWFALKPEELHLLKVYHINHALPVQNAIPKRLENPLIEEFSNVFLASEQVFFASINGALLSGKTAARAAIDS